MSYKRYTVSCLLCKSEVSLSGFTKHYNSKQCQSGKGIFKFSKLNNCPHCDLDISTTRDSANHIRWCDLNPTRGNGIMNNPNRGKQFQTQECYEKRAIGISNAHTSGKYLDAPTKAYKTKEINGTLNHTEQSKAKLSIARSKFLSENPDKHVWKRSDKHKSSPCNTLKRYLLDNDFNFIEEFTPLKTRHFSIDIYFPDKNLGIEINGNQHYTSDGNLAPYYQNRHDLIEESGIKLLEIRYFKCYTEKGIDEICDLISKYNS